MDNNLFGTRAGRSDRNQGVLKTKELNTNPVLVADTHHQSVAYVAALLLHQVAAVGGTRVKPTTTRELFERIASVLPSDVRGACEEEVIRIADWFLYPPEEGESLPEPVRFLRQAEIDLRRSSIELAIEEELDLELEFWDEVLEIWPRTRVTPLALVWEHEDGHTSVPGEMADVDSNARLLLQAKRGAQILVVPIYFIRWLMPVVPGASPVDAPTADVLAFPTSERDDE